MKRLIYWLPIGLVLAILIGVMVWTARAGTIIVNNGGGAAGASTTINISGGGGGVTNTDGSIMTVPTILGNFTGTAVSVSLPGIATQGVMLTPSNTLSVAPWGSDTNNGTSGQPFLTLGKAMDALVTAWYTNPVYAYTCQNSKNLTNKTFTLNGTTLIWTSGVANPPPLGYLLIPTNLNVSNVRIATNLYLGIITNNLVPIGTVTLNNSTVSVNLTNGFATYGMDYTNYAALIITTNFSPITIGTNTTIVLAAGNILAGHPVINNLGTPNLQSACLGTNDNIVGQGKNLSVVIATSPGFAIECTVSNTWRGWTEIYNNSAQNLANALLGPGIDCRFEDGGILATNDTDVVFNNLLVTPGTNTFSND